MIESRSLRWATAAGVLLTFGVFFPGMMSPDSLDQLRQANAWTFSTTQPPVMSVFWGALNLVVAGPALMLALQALAWWVGWALVISRVVPARGYWQPLVLLALGFWPPLFAMTGTIWRDVHMTLALLLATGLLLQDPAVGRVRLRVVFAGVLVAYASAVRVNAIFSVLPLAGWVVVSAWRAWQIPLPRRASLAAGGLVVLAMTLAGRVLNPALASEMWYPVQNLQVFDLVGVSVRTGQNLVPPAIRNGNETPERLSEFYTAFSCFPSYHGLAKGGKVISENRLLGTTDDAVLAEIASAWRQAIMSHPRAYLEHRAAVFAANMGWEDLPLHYAYERGVPANELGVTYRASWLSDRAYAAFDSTLAYVSWLWRPWLYVWGSLLVLGAGLFAWRRGKRFPLALLVVGSGGLYTLPYLFAAPAADLRYHHWPIAATFAGALLLAAEVGLPSLRRLVAGALGVVAASVLLGWAAWSSHIDFGPSAPISPRAHAALERGRQLLSQGEWLAAGREFQASAQRSPYWWVPVTNLGIVAHQLHDDTAALAFFDRAVADRRAEGAALHRANFLLELGRHREALDAYAALGGTEHCNYPVCKGATSAALRLGDIDTGVAYATRCLSLDQAAFSRDIIEVAKVFFESPEASLEGLKFFQALAQVAPNQWWVHANLGLLAQRSSRTELAERGLAMAAALKAGNHPPGPVP